MRRSKCPKCKHFSSSPYTQRIQKDGKYKLYTCSMCKHTHSVIEIPLERYHNLLENAGEGNGRNRTKRVKDEIRLENEKKENESVNADEKEREKRKQETDRAWEKIERRKKHATIQDELDILKAEDSKKALEIIQLKKIIRKAGIKL